MTEIQNGLHEECGVFGVYNVADASSLLYYGLHSLQHRGQEGCGIVCVDGNGEFYRRKGLGLISDVFDADKLSQLKGSMGIGHVRYSTHGGGGLDNVQPFYFRHKNGNFALAHNGNIVNSKQLSDMLEDMGTLFHSTSDSELLAHLIKKNDNTPRIEAIIDALNKLEGSFAFLIMTENRIYACRDKDGIRPLSIGTLGDGYVISSETCAFEVIGARFLRDVEPGEIVCIDRHGLRSNFYTEDRHRKLCAMEFIYFSVIGVPDSSLSAAMGYSEVSGIPYEMGLIKSKYVGRTFIMPSQSLREMGVKLKLSAVRSIVEGKRVVLIDDSIVRGTTSRRIVDLLRESGATEVHVRIASPALTHPCFYGVDIPTREELISSDKNAEEVCKAIHADSLHFLSRESTLKAAKGRCELCFACFSGEYPTTIYTDTEN